MNMLIHHIYSLGVTSHSTLFLAAPKPNGEPSGEEGWEEQSPGGWKLLEATLFNLQAGTMGMEPFRFDETSLHYFH
jgi:hypothetical protein